MPDRWQLMNGSTQFVKDVRMLNLPREITEHALRLIDQCELPVVIWPNTKQAVNTGAPHSGNPYQFWILIQAGATEGEAARLLLSLLNFNIQHRMRCLIPFPRDAYLKSLHGAPDRIEMLMKLVATICSFCMSLVSEFYLSPHAIATDPKIRQFKTDYTKQSLLEYIRKQRSFPYPALFCWHRENEASNLIEYASCARYSPENARWFTEELSHTRPPSSARHYCDVLAAILGVAEAARQRYNGSNSEDIINEIERQLIEILKLEDMLCLRAMNAFRSEPSSDGRYKRIYTFVPVGIEHEALALKGVRTANECLGLLREIGRLDERQPLPKVSFSMDSDVNMRAYNDRDGNTYILIFLNYLLALEHAVGNHRFSDECAWIVHARGMDYARERLFRYAIFYATLHEYGHILHGDIHAPMNDAGLRQQEDRADVFADRYFCWVLLHQYRPTDPASFFAHTNEDKSLAREAKAMIKQLREQYGHDAEQ